MGNKSPRAPVSLSLGEIADLTGGRVVGDAGHQVGRVAPVDEATPDSIAFLALQRYAAFAPDSGAGAFLVTEELLASVPEGRASVVVDNGYAALQALLTHLHPERSPQPGVHETAVLGAAVELGSDVSIGPYVVIGEGVTIGDGSALGAHCVVGDGTTIGARTRLHPQVVVYEESTIGDDVIVHSGARIGSDGFGYTFVDGEHRKMPQVGRAVIEDGVEIGANTTIDRGSLGDTVVSRGSKIDNLVQVAHNVRVGARSLLAALVGIAGSTRLGQRVWVGGQAGIINQLRVGDDVKVTVGSMITRDVPDGETMSGYPARPHREDLKRNAELGRIGKLKARVERLEDELKQLSD